ncbi:uncharacterized protein TNCV_610171 [Trichonephila clavipes]|nr:uncharacterized protein TNCV_610171 [Trichonephila clavipes]
MRSSPVPLRTRRVGKRCTLNMLRAETPSRGCGVVGKSACVINCNIKVSSNFQNTPYRVANSQKMMPNWFYRQDFSNIPLGRHYKKRRQLIRHVCALFAAQRETIKRIRRPSRINPENRVGSSFRIIPEQYFSGIENIDDFLENIDHNLAYYEIPAQLACAYLKGHLKGRALDWFEVLGYRVIEDKTTDYAHLKQALSEQFPVVRNRSELETRFYSSSQRRDQQPSDFIYELLKIHKVLKLEMSEEKLIDHVVSRLEPQILDYVEVRHPRNTANLLQIVDKYQERFMHRQIRGSSEGFRSSGPNEGNRFNTRHRQENWRENGNNERYANNNRPQREFNRFENQGFTNNRRFEGRRQGGQSDQRFHNQGGRQNGSRNSSFQG